MNIKPVIYEQLSPDQRVIATIEAEARGDDIEVERLVKTCPKHTYTMTDPAYTSKIVHIIALSLAVECDIRGYVAGALMSLIIDDDKNMTALLQNIRDICTAWDQTLQEAGISAGSMKKLAPPCFPYQLFFDPLLPPPNAAQVKFYYRGMQDFLATK